VEGCNEKIATMEMSKHQAGMSVAATTCNVLCTCMCLYEVRQVDCCSRMTIILRLCKVCCRLWRVYLQVLRCYSGAIVLCLLRCPRLCSRC